MCSASTPYDGLLLLAEPAAPAHIDAHTQTRVVCGSSVDLSMDPIGAGPLSADSVTECAYYLTQQTNTNERHTCIGG
jgi:hypothetical protein